MWVCQVTVSVNLGRSKSLISLVVGWVLTTGIFMQMKIKKLCEYKDDYFLC